MSTPEKQVARYKLTPHRRVCLFFLLGVFFMSPPARAIDIILNYETGKTLNPAQDVGATGLQDLFAYAESFYEGVFEDSAANTSVILNFWYDDLDSISTTTIGHHALVNQTNSGGTEPWREVEANLRFDNDRAWFIDPTPEDDTEFDMSQTLWRDLSGAQQSDFYNDFTAINIPETFEVGLRGVAVPGGDAAGVVDLLSTVMHEVGHALGMSSGATGTIDEVGVDRDYDFDTDFIFGQTLAAEARFGSVGHIDVDFAMMCGGCAATGLRRMPSHTDLFSMASGNQYALLDVPRREYYGGTDWNTSGNWSGNQAPGVDDDVFVRDPGAIVQANLSANGFAANLTIAEGGRVDTQSFKLTVAQTVLITGTSSNLFIRSGGELQATGIQIQDQSEVRPEVGGLIDVDTMDIDATSSLIGAGTVDVSATLNNDGALTASGGDLTFTTAGGAVWNLGGGGGGVINAINGSISFFGGTPAGSFNGTLNVGVGRSFSMDTGGLSNTGQIILAGGTYIAPSLNQFGTLEVNTSASAILASSSFESGSTNTLNADLDLLGDSLISAGATFSGAGSLNVAAGTTLTAISAADVGVKIVNDGSVVIGSSPTPGVLGVVDFTQTAAGQIGFELQGLTQGVTYDWMNVGNSATLDGLLSVTLLGGFIPNIGNSFDILTAGTGIAGAFSSVAFPTIPNVGLGITYSANTVTLNAGLLGDLNSDGLVDILDLNIVLTHWNTNTTAGVWLGGDPTGDGFIDILDLNVVLGNWNAGTPPQAQALALVPEPGMLGLLSMVSLSVAARRSRRCR